MLISTMRVPDMFPFFCVSCSSIIPTLDEDTKGAWENNNGSLLLANVLAIVFQYLHYLQDLFSLLTKERKITTKVSFAILGLKTGELCCCVYE